MPGVQMCPVCRGSKQKCEPAARIWIPGGRQDKCARCIQFNHGCGPHEYPPPRPRASRVLDARSQTSSGSLQLPADVSPSSTAQRVESPTGAQDIKQELWRKLKALDMQVEATKKLKLALDYLVSNGRQNEPLYSELLSSRNANVRILTLMPAQAEALADRLAVCGEIEAAERAYSRILDTYREFPLLEIKAWHETKSLLKKMADILWETGEPVRAEKLIWEALSSRDFPAKALPSDIDMLKSLAKSLPKTCIDISKSIRSIVEAAIPSHLYTPFPPLQCMMRSPFASTVSGSPFHRGEFTGTNITPDWPILGGIESVMDFLRVLPIDTLDARDIYGQSPFYVASSLGMEGLARGILLRLAEVSHSGNEDHLNTRDCMGQTVLGASIIGGCSLQYIRFLVESGAQIDPDPLRELPYTPLQSAARSGSLDIVCLLLDKGAEIDRVFPGNDTPLALAEQAGHADIVGQLSIAITSYSDPALHLGWNPG